MPKALKVTVAPENVVEIYKLQWVENPEQQAVTDWKQSQQSKPEE